MNIWKRKSPSFGFISTRFAGLDGVSLETQKWADVITSRGCSVFYMAGELDTDPAISHLSPKAHFQHESIIEIQQTVFTNKNRSPEISKKILDLAEELKEEIYRFHSKFGFEILVVEIAAELAKRMEPPKSTLVISHKADDEGHGYLQRIREFARFIGVEIRIVSDRIGPDRGTDAKGNKIYTLWDAYLHADIVTYPSLYEGYGNAFVETIYMRKPIAINRYPILSPISSQKDLKLSRLTPTSRPPS